jgi:hypothetical protein
VLVPNGIYLTRIKQWDSTLDSGIATNSVISGPVSGIILQKCDVINSYYSPLQKGWWSIFKNKQYTTDPKLGFALPGGWSAMDCHQQSILSCRESMLGVTI